jgi:uncharacterized membrane protein YkoI
MKKENTMKRITVSVVLMIATSLLVVGCSAMNKEDDDTRHEEIAISALPANVKASFDKTYPGATIKEVEKETYADGTVHYEIEFTTKEGADSEVEIDAGGEVLPEH